MLRVCMAAATILAAASAAAQPACVPGAAPFAASGANQVKGKELAEALTGKTIVVVRAQGTAAAEPQLRLKIDFRADGSAMWRCTARAKSADAWKKCKGFAAAKAEDRETGAWRIDGDRLVLRRAATDTEGSFTLHRHGKAVALQPVAGKGNCLPGAAKFD
ncbi:MAG: hypothetical protein KIT16_20035 [Rhodospirillaceae bacterium]|nr:hypothetical protein [Rhodospirillaceae bacterium]